MTSAIPSCRTYCITTPVEQWNQYELAVEVRDGVGEQEFKREKRNLMEAIARECGLIIIDIKRRKEKTLALVLMGESADSVRQYLAVDPPMTGIRYKQKQYSFVPHGEFLVSLYCL